MLTSIMPELTAQFEAIKKLHDEDLARGFTGVFLDNQLEKKYPSAGKEFTWQWFFPQKSLTAIPAKQELRRYHLSDVRTTMIYTHCVPSKTIKETKSPLDF